MRRDLFKVATSNCVPLRGAAQPVNPHPVVATPRAHIYTCLLLPMHSRTPWAWEGAARSDAGASPREQQAAPLLLMPTPPSLLFLSPRDDNGRTALHWAAQMDFSAAAEAVLAAAEKKRAQLRAEQAAAAAAAKAASAAAAAGAPAPAAPAAGEGEDDDSVPPPIFVFQDKQGCTALHLAARQGHVAAVRLLLGAAAGGGGGPEAVAALCRTRSKAGHNALHLAALAGSSRCAALLAAAALDAAAGKSKLGLTPADLAARRRHTGLQTALRGQRPVQALQALAAVQEAEAGQREAQQRTLLMAPPECLFHFTCPAPITR